MALDEEPEVVVMSQGFIGQGHQHPGSSSDQHPSWSNTTRPFGHMALETRHARQSSLLYKTGDDFPRLISDRTVDHRNDGRQDSGVRVFGWERFVPQDHRSHGSARQARVSRCRLLRG